ncbi:hypothetical protein [Planobispora longispora]|uniref:Uncharacterized protein n=1 Tax=Planobispora longispora TaxID=28887 RepID=A0A8J3W970_9ACTN|nr:hypothetical protein [Planobispora longispora]BFE78329.1 hypothetical protein GCM10020093_009300 [Planobispora longispora]GIH81424.1 hypothetical protein Plo01_78530 [Planobispora longispora]
MTTPGADHVDDSADIDLNDLLPEPDDRLTWNDADDYDWTR